MTATIEILSQLIRTQDGNVDHFPTRAASYTPKKRVTIPGTMVDWRRGVVVPKRTPTSPQPDPVLLWKWEPWKPMFEFLSVATSDPTGFVYVSFRADKPTSDTDLTPLGTHANRCTFGLSCSSPFTLNTASTLVNPSVSVSAGVDADGFPSMLTDPGSVPGFIYEVWARSSTIEADVPVDVLVLA